LLHDDVMRRVVHPWVARVAPGTGDDVSWQTELQELAAERLIGVLERHEEPLDSSRLQELAMLVGETIDRNEARIIDLLRTNMDDRRLQDLGNAIYEACATAVLPAQL
jgi:hypothetical protein